MVKNKIQIFIVVLAIFFSSFAQAQQPPEEESKSKYGPRKQLATIIFCGLGGAVLGLSTLSFYGRPQDKLVNIAIGFGIGVIGGTVFTLYQMTSQPKEVYGLNMGQPESLAMLDSAGQSGRHFSSKTTPGIGLNYSF